MANVKPIPDGYHTVTPYLYVNGAEKAIEFYTKAFGAKERLRMPGPGGTIGHAELEIGDSVVMLAEESEMIGNRSPQTLGGTASSILLYVDDVDEMFKRAIDAGATELRPVEDQFYGDRTGGLLDPFGHEWSIGTHVEDVSGEEVARRSQELLEAAEGQGQPG